MVNYCVCGGCTNTSLSGHRVHRFPNKKKDGASFRAWVRFVQVKRRDFTSASASKHAVVCSVHFRPEDYHSGDMMEFNMGCRSKNQVRLKVGAVPSVHTAPSSGPPSACCSAAGGRHDDGHGSVRNAARRKRKLCISGVAADDDSYDEEFEDDDEEEDDEDHSRAHDGTLSMNSKTQGQCLTGSNPNVYFAIPTFNTNQAKHVSTEQVQNRSDVALGQLTKRFVQLLHNAPNGVLDLNEVTRKLGTRKRRVYDITNVLTGIHLIKKTSKNKIQWMGPGAVSEQWSPKTKADLLNLKSTEEALDWLIKDCAQQLFALTDLKDNADSAYVTYDDICKIDVFKDQTIIAIRAPEETKLEVPTPTEESIQIHLKGTRGPIHILTCETEGQSDAVDPANPESQLVKPAYFLSLEESRIHTKPLKSDVSSTVAAVQSA